MVRVLRHFGCEVDFPPRQTCCGQAARNAGFQGDARAFAGRWVECFAGSEWIITPSASCAKMVREHYSSLLAEDGEILETAEFLAGRTYEFQAFLEEVLELGPGDLPCLPAESVTYHHPCHARGSGPAEEPPVLTARWTADRWRPCARTDQCCGFGGVFAVHHPEVSAAMGRDKLRALCETGADTVVCNEAGCTLHLSGLAHRDGVFVRFRHLAELLADSLDAIGGEP